MTPFDVRAGALALVRAVPHLGPGVVLAIVDPGVGTTRRGVAVSVPSDASHAGPHHLVGPDNGLLLWAADALGGVERAVSLPPPPQSSHGLGATFDGRDVFAPAAARLWQGTPLAELGDDLDPGTLVRLTPPLCSRSHGALQAEVQWVDRFGNVQLAARPDDATASELGDDLEVVATATHRARRVRAFAALGPGALGVVVDANGHLALVCDRRSAATVLRVQPGDVVTLRTATSGPGSP